MNRQSFPILVPFVLSLTFVVGIANAAQVYKWIDEQGRVQFSQFPPLSVPSEQSLQTIELKAAPVPEVSSTEDGDGEPTGGDNDPTTRWEQLREENCRIARGNLASLESGASLAIEEGENRREMSAAEREAQIKRAKRHIDVYCE